ncbi:MAG: hypothetical protein EP344_05035 [Bacteroidetes bacterium]|nr:MAG: hypothetical protein EP344_05035 [Bacteroidota bacterium]
MKRTLYPAAILFFLALISTSHVQAQTCTVTFQADFRGVEVNDPGTIGIRGSKAPLDWNKTMPMQDADKDGVYTLTVSFDNCKAGEPLQYKFIHSEDGWENDLLGPMGNREVTLVDGAQKTPVQQYDKLETFSTSVLLERSDLDNFYSVIFTIGTGKKRGLSTDAIAKEYYDFWHSGGTNDWPPDPQAMMLEARIGQATSNGTFDVLEDKPGMVKYRISKVWDKYFGDRTDIKGVTKADINAVWKNLVKLRVESKGWTMNWNEDKETVEITINAQPSDK